MFFTEKKGFTLIELLVVIAIIGLLSSVVLTSLQSARVKARDAAIKKTVLELRNSVELIRDSHNGSYADIQNGNHWSNLNDSTTPSLAKYGCGWLAPPGVSSPPKLYPNLSTAEGDEIRKICESIVVLSRGNKSSDINVANYVLKINVLTSGARNTTNAYSIMAQLASGSMFCIGSSGRSSITPGVGFFTSGVNDNVGCSDNP